MHTDELYAYDVQPPPLNLKKIYMGIADDFRNHREDCFKDHMKSTQKAIELAWAYTKRFCPTGDVTNCALYLIKMLKNHVITVSKQMKNVRCVGLTYGKYLPVLTSGLKLPNADLILSIDALRSSYNIYDEPYDLVEAYLDIIEDPIDNKPSCLRPQMEIVSNEMERAHKDAQICLNKLTPFSIRKCNEEIKDRLLSVFYKTDEIQKELKCFDTTYSPIVTRVIVFLRDDDFLKVTGNFANSDIVNVRINLGDVYNTIIRKLQPAKDTDCHRKFLLNAQQLLEEVYEDVGKCFDENLMNRCEAMICARTQNDRMSSYFSEDKKRFAASRCVSKDYELILDYMNSFSKYRNETAYNYLVSFAEESINYELFKPINIYKELFDGNLDNKYGCAKDAAIQLQILLESAYNDAVQALAESKKTDKDADLLPIVERIKAFFKSVSKQLPPNCANEQFQRICEESKEPLKRRSSDIVGRIKEFAAADVIPTLNLDEMDKSIARNMPYWKIVMHTNHMPETETVLKGAKSDAKRCCASAGGAGGDACFDSVVEGIRKHFVWLTSESASYNCFISAYCTMRDMTMKALKLPKPKLIEYVREYGGCPSKSTSDVVKTAYVKAIDDCFDDESKKMGAMEAMVQSELPKCFHLNTSGATSQCGRNLQGKINSSVDGTARSQMQCLNAVMSSTITWYGDRLL